MASKGYPASPIKGDEIKNLKEIDLSTDEYIFHAGTKLDGNKIIISGGRVLNVTALGDTLEAAIEKTYECINKIETKNLQYRNDIGVKGLLKKGK